MPLAWENISNIPVYKYDPDLSVQTSTTNPPPTFRTRDSLNLVVTTEQEFPIVTWFKDKKELLVESTKYSWIFLVTRIE